MSRGGLADELRAIGALYERPERAVLHALTHVGGSAGFVDDDGVALVSECLGVTEARVRSVLSFYHLLAGGPRGKYHLMFCTNLSCMTCGAYDIVEHLRSSLGVPPGEVTPDGLFSYEEAECFGLCDLAPAWLVNLEALEGTLTRSKVDALLDDLRRRA